MAIQTGNIKYRGSFKNIRQYRNLHDPNTYAGEKGGANRDLIMNNPAFARTRENMNEFSGCGLADFDLAVAGGLFCPPAACRFSKDAKGHRRG